MKILPTNQGSVALSLALAAMLLSCSRAAQQEPSTGLGEDQPKIQQMNQRIHTLLQQTQDGMGVSHANIAAMEKAKTIGEQQKIFEASLKGMDRIKPALDSVALYAEASRKLAVQHPADLSARVLDSMDIVLADVAHAYRKYADEYDSLWYYLCQVDTDLPVATTKMPWAFQQHQRVKDSLEREAVSNKARLQYLTNRWSQVKPQ